MEYFYLSLRLVGDKQLIVTYNLWSTYLMTKSALRILFLLISLWDMDSIANMLQGYLLYICVCHSNGTQELEIISAFACCAGSLLTPAVGPKAEEAKAKKQRRKIGETIKPVFDNSSDALQVRFLIYSSNRRSKSKLAYFLSYCRRT